MGGKCSVCQDERALCKDCRAPLSQCVFPRGHAGSTDCYACVGSANPDSAARKGK